MSLANDPARPERWYASKKMFVVLTHHALVFSGGIIGTIIDPAAAPSIWVAAISAISLATVGHNVGQSAVDRAQAYSPNVALPTGAQTSASISPPPVVIAPSGGPLAGSDATHLGGPPP